MKQKITLADLREKMYPEASDLDFRKLVAEAREDKRKTKVKTGFSRVGSSNKYL
jgi:hypothetical protein